MTRNFQQQIQHRYQIGMQIVDPNGKILGDVTSIFQEGRRLFAVVDDNYEVDLTAASEVIDLRGTLRHANPALKDPHIRLGLAA